MNGTNKTYRLHVDGMHCAACSVVIEHELAQFPGVASIRVSTSDRVAEVSGDFGEKSDHEIAEALSERVRIHGYALAVAKTDVAVAYNELWYAVPLAFVFVAGFLALQKAGLINIIDGGAMTLGTAFVIGVVASLSTCMAVVGGLVLSISASYAKSGDSVVPQSLFHAGRFVSFFVLGGAIGALGGVFTPSALLSAFLGIAIGLVMLALGVNLLELFPWARKFQLSMPRAVSSRAHALKNIHSTLMPAVVGAATFFLPCGFTQSMQLYTLSTGSFIAGALTMSAFALGTFPILALVSFSSARIEGSAWKGVFFKTAGLIVILFGLFNIVNSLVIIGIVPPLFSF